MSVTIDKHAIAAWPFRINGIIIPLIVWLLLCLPFSRAEGQIPNNGFENWSSTNGYLIPNFWGNLNVITNSSGIYTATRVNPGMVGSYYVDLTSRNVPGRGIVPGIVTSGPIDTVTFLPISGFPYSGRPDALKGKWQYMGFGADQGFIEIIFTKWNTGTNSRDTIGYVKQILSGMEMSWTDMYIPITYFQTSMPDTCIIVLSSSGPAPEEESFLYIDELFFDGFVGIEMIQETKLRIYPNPSSEEMDVQLENDNMIGNNLMITNVTGEVMLTKTITQVNETIDLNGFASGIYFINIIGEDVYVTKKMLIE